ncbi:hypothetical protein [Pseudomonas sp.]|uniref:hypothetical protein n=1 Tax=Pseudomonas sp. TaxID=306 RepID=UPI002622D62F|nr:hypothetical protein [Pseudomonas sp.]
MAIIIVSVVDGGGNSVGNGGETSSDRVTLKGIASRPAQQLRIIDGANLLTQTTSNSDGRWEALVRGLVAKRYIIQASSEDGQEVSEEWKVVKI